MRLAFVLRISSVLLLSWPLQAQTPVRLTLENEFIEKYADCGLIEATFTIDAAHKKPNAPAKDGDMHIAGRAPEIGLPCVAELINAKFEKEELQIVKENTGNGTPVRIVGAWRIWAEHAGGEPQIQKLGNVNTIPAAETSNPDHLFEIHPIVSMNGESSTTGWRPIDGFQTKDAHDAFTRYENIRCQIIPIGTKQTEIRTSMAGYNYVEFQLELHDKDNGHEMKDGCRSYFTQIHDLDGDLLVRRCRCIFFKGTEPFEKVKASSNGSTLHVLGIPRVSLALVKWRLEHQNDPNFPNALEWNLPYEIEIVGIYDNE